VPELASSELEIVAIAREVGLLSKVAVRQRLRVHPTAARPVLLVLGRAGERIRAVREELGHERVEIVQWHADPMRYVSAAVGLSYVPSGVLYPILRRAEILLGEIEYRGARGWRDVNQVLASALTGWHLSIEPIAGSPNWGALETARIQARGVPAEIVGRTPKGLQVRVYDLNGLLPFGQIRGVSRKTPAAVLEAAIARLRSGQVDRSCRWTEQRCSDCGVVKPMSEFTRIKGSITGHYGCCPTCRARRARDRAGTRKAKGTSAAEQEPRFRSWRRGSPAGGLSIGLSAWRRSARFSTHRPGAVQHASAGDFIGWSYGKRCSVARDVGGVRRAVSQPARNREGGDRQPASARTVGLGDVERVRVPGVVSSELAYL